MTGADAGGDAPRAGGPPGGLVVISGPGGVGKGTVVRELASRRDDVEVAVSATTREPRPGERDGVDYHFLDDATFTARIESGDFLEWAEFNGRRYGTLRSAVDGPREQGRTLVLEIEVQGARQIRQRESEAVLVLVVPPSEEELLARLRARGDDEETVARRLEIARWELARANEFDYQVVNDTVPGCVSALEAILDRAGATG